MFIIEFFRVRDTDHAHATLGQVEHDTSDLEDSDANQTGIPI